MLFFTKSFIIRFSVVCGSTF